MRKRASFFGKIAWGRLQPGPTARCEASLVYEGQGLHKRYGRQALCSDARTGKVVWKTEHKPTVPKKASMKTGGVISLRTGRLLLGLLFCREPGDPALLHQCV